MLEKPKSLKEQVLTPLGFSLIALISVTSSITALLLFNYELQNGGDVELARSYVFALFAVIGLIYIFSYRNMKISLLKTNKPMANKPLLVSVAAGFILVFSFFNIPFLRDILKLTTLNLEEYGLLFLIALLILFLVEMAKLLNRVIEVRHKSAI